MRRRIFMRNTVSSRQLLQLKRGELLAESFPPRALALVEEWRVSYRSELTEDWRLARERRVLKKIAPLE